MLSRFNVTLSGIYRWLVTFESAPWLIEILSAISAILKSTKHGGQIIALVYERKFKSDYLEKQIYERLLNSEPSIVKCGVRVGLVVRALAFHQCGQSSISAPGVICGLN